MEIYYEFENGIVISSNTIEKIIDQYFEMIKKELPKEAQIGSVVQFVNESISERTLSKKIQL